MEIRTIGIDLGKTVFHFVAVDAHGQVVVRKKGSRTQLLRFTAKLRHCLIGMEACGGAHFLGQPRSRPLDVDFDASGGRKALRIHS